MEAELREAKHRRAGALAEEKTGGTEAGALPDFAIIGQRKCGTTFLYHLLTLHPYVEPAATKETHFFGAYFGEGVDWYRRFFSPPKWKDGRRMITGEATPLMANHHAPERMASVIPDARLIALLRNPVDRAYSDYQMLAGRARREFRSFEEAIGLDDDGGLDEGSGYLLRGVYVDHLLRWSEYYDRDRMLVLKSEDFYERPVKTLQGVLRFLYLPEWEPDAVELPTKRNAGNYGEGMAPETRRALEEFFAPHNRRLYEFLGEDYGW
jgi:hypothetical protein